jgi:hypothetical protein
VSQGIPNGVLIHGVLSAADRLLKWFNEEFPSSSGVPAIEKVPENSLTCNGCSAYKIYPNSHSCYTLNPDINQHAVFYKILGSLGISGVWECSSHPRISQRPENLRACKQLINLDGVLLVNPVPKG